MTLQHRYRAYGLTIASDLDLPEMTPVGTDTAEASPADVTITLGEAARAAHQATAMPVKAYAGFYQTPDGPAMWAGETAHYLVRGGKTIDVTLLPGADSATVRLFLLGSCMGMIFHQRGQLVLHGAAIRRGDAISVFVGDSGAGKSTLAAHLGRQGFAVLSDDTLPLSPRADGRYQAWPGSSMFKLWRASLDGLGEGTEDLPSVGARQDKYYYRNPATAPDQPLPLREVIALDKGDVDAPPKLIREDGLKALSIIADNAYRPEFASLLDQQDAHFKRCAAVSGTVAAYRLIRPWDPARMGETIALLKDHWAG